MLLKYLFIGINIVYSLNINIISKILAPDGESKLKHDYFGYQRRQLQMCVQELCLKPPVGTTWSWHEMQRHANLI